MKRIINISIWFTFGSLIVPFTHCLLGGKLGHLLLAIYAYIILRNIIIIFIADKPFMLDGKPLPAFLYLLPCPAPPNIWKFLQLYVLPVGFGLMGWIFGGKQIISPIISSNYFWIIYIISCFLHLIYSVIIITKESKWPYFGSLNESGPFKVYLLSLWGILKWLITVGYVLAIFIWLLRI